MRILRIGIVFVWMSVIGGSLWAVGPLVRVANTTLKVPLEPGGVGYSAVAAFGGLTFPNPVALVTPPGETGRLFVVERGGRISVITNLAAPTRTVFLDLKDRVRLDGFNEMGLLGLAFHPGYSTNGRFFVFYTTTASTTGRPNDRHDRLSEFRAEPPTTATADAATERLLIQQADDLVNHNGGDLHFGPDGYLYVAVGDEGGGDDTGNNGQRIDKDFFSGILRIDVDKRPGNLPPNPHPAVVGDYRVPADNPYVGATSFNGRAVVASAVRTEFWSVGLRNPWRMAFDRLTGELWVGDVGQGRREGVVIARPGSNHGWPYREHDIAGPRAGSMPAAFVTDAAYTHVPPLWSYAHGSGAGQGNSIIGGRVYRGKRLGALYGAYVFADYVSGNVWSLRRAPDGPVVTRLLGVPSVSAFGEDPVNGDLLLADHQGGQILRLNYSSTSGGTALPARLSATGAFSDLTTLVPNAGIVPYEVNVPFWSDGAIKRRWFSIPDLAQRFRYDPVASWGAPTGAVWIKHFDLELHEGDPTTRRRLETRFLVRNASGVHGFTYRWNAAQSDAELVSEAGADESLERVVGGKPLTQVWRYPGRSECQFCHNPAAGFTLGFSTAQLHRSFQHGGVSTNFVAALAGAGYFSNEPASIHTAPTLVNGTDESASVGWRARSWLAANCAACHQPGAPGGGRFDARISTPLELSGLMNGVLVSGTSDAADRVIVPGDSGHSVLLRRLSTRGVGQMPPLATDRVDADGVALIRQWIEALATPPPPPVEVRLGIEAVGGKLLVRANHPAEHAVRIESTPFPIGRAGWTPVDVPGNEYFVPATDGEQTLELELPATDGLLFRAVLLEP